MATFFPIIFVHGWGGNQRQYLNRARAVAELGFVCLTFDLRGHARSDGQRETVSREDNLRDLLAAYDVLARQQSTAPSSLFRARARACPGLGPNPARQSRRSAWASPKRPL